MELLVTARSVRTALPSGGDALLVVDGKVAAVGAAADLRRPGIVERAFPEGVIVPGLRDAHFHPVGFTSAVTRLTVKGAADFDELIRLVRATAGELAPGEPVIGTRLDDETLAERALPDRRHLDAAAGDRPVLLYRYCGHIAVASTTALELAGIGPGTPDPPGGRFDRDDTGIPTGILRETAVQRVAGAVGDRSTGLSVDDVRRALQALPSLGLTSIGAIVATGDGPWCEVGDELSLVLEAAADCPLRLPVLVIAETPAELEEAASRLSAAGPNVSFLGFKDFADGSLGGHTAAMREPFADRPGERGTVRLTARTATMARAALAMGGQVALHAIGDHANHAVLELFRELREEGAPAAALRVEHASVLDDSDVDLMAELGVTASVQPAFLASETGWLERRLGRERLGLTYRFRSLAEAGVPLAGGSDCPVEPPDPLWGMAAARDRAGITPNEGLGAAPALDLFTAGAARTLRQPEPLAPESPADFVVLDTDPLHAPPEDVRNAGVVATWIGGVEVPVPERPLAWPG